MPGLESSEDSDDSDNNESEVRIWCSWIKGSPSSLYESHKDYNIASNYKGLYGIFYNIAMEVVKSENSQ